MSPVWSVIIIVVAGIVAIVTRLEMDRREHARREQVQRELRTAIETIRASRRARDE